MFPIDRHGGREYHWFSCATFLAGKRIKLLEFLVDTSPKCRYGGLVVDNGR